MPALYTHKCICGCNATFRTTKPEATYASQACKELHIGQEQRDNRRGRSSALAKSYKTFVPDPLAPLRLNPREWISASELALKLLTDSSVISKLSAEGIIPFYEISPKYKRYKLLDVIEALESYNSKRTRKILTAYFRSR